MALEGHIEDIVLLKDDAELFRRGSAAIVHLVAHVADAVHAADWGRMQRAKAALERLAAHFRERYAHLTEVGIPEVVACYTALEAAVG